MQIKSTPERELPQLIAYFNERDAKPSASMAEVLAEIDALTAQTMATANVMREARENHAKQFSISDRTEELRTEAHKKQPKQNIHD